MIEKKRILILILVFVLIFILILVENQFSSVFLILIVFTTMYFPYNAKYNEYKKYLLPTTIILICLTILPFLIAIFISFFEVTGVSFNNFPWNFIFLKNYSTIFNSEPDLLALVRTFEFSIIAVFFEMGLGLLIGYKLSKLPSKYYFINLVLIIPVILPSLISGMLWRSIFDQSFGLANRILNLFSIGNISWLSLNSPNLFNVGAEKILNINLGFFSALVVEIWQWTPFVAVLIGTSLKSIPNEMLDYFNLNFRSKWQLFKSLHLNYLKQILLIVAIIRFIDCFKTYDAIWVLFANNIDTSTISIRIANYALEIRNYGQGASLSIILIILIMTIIVLFVGYLKKKRVFDLHYE